MTGSLANVFDVLRAADGKCIFLDGGGITLYPRCPECRRVRLSPWVKGDDSGMVCLKCGYKTRNSKPVVTEFKCGCGRRMGRLTIDDERLEPKRICGWCAERRIVKGIEPNPRVEVRREVFCACGCGKLVAWTDFKETVSLVEVERRSRYFYAPCARAGRREIQRLYWPKTLSRLSALEVSVSQPGTTINNITGDVTQSFSTQLVQVIQQSSSPAFWFGNGADGALTLVADTTAAAQANVKRFTTFDLATFKYNHNSADFGLVIYCSVSLTSSSGGKIVADTIGGAGAGGASVGGSGAGGAGGGAAGFVFVYAKKMTGTGLIGGGVAGVNGLNGGAASGGSGGGNAGAGASGGGVGSTQFWLGNAGFTKAGGGGGAGGPIGGAPGAGGTAGTGPGPTTGATQTQKDYLRYLFSTGLWEETVSAVTPPDTRMNCGQAAGGGGSGATGGTGPGSGVDGGSGGGGAGYTGNGGVGGVGGRLDTASNTTGGGGGGGGGSVAITVVVTQSISSTWTISCNGGVGGNGGNGSTGAPGGGGGGGGGAGGTCVFVAPSGSGVTATAAGGAGGVKGTGGTTAAAVDGNPGTAGVAHNVAY